MLSLVVTLLIIALIAGILGFGGIAGAAVGIAKIVFFVALVLFLISLATTGFPVIPFAVRNQQRAARRAFLRAAFFYSPGRVCSAIKHPNKIRGQKWWTPKTIPI
jgi:uncharacterized membrane protein YtjA (UPF0391 family)